MIAAIDWLRRLPSVDPGRIGLIGASMGGQVALLAAARRPAIRCVAALFPPTDLPGWYEPAKVIAQASLLVAPRPGVMLWTAERLAAALGVAASEVRLRFVACPPIDIASRELRRSVADGMSIRYMVPRAVEEYIRQHKLYTAG